MSRHPRRRADRGAPDHRASQPDRGRRPHDRGGEPGDHRRSPSGDRRTPTSGARPAQPPTASRHAPGRHELGQSFLVDRAAVRRIVDLVAETDGPIVEIGTGDGAITQPLARLGRPIRGLELDARRAARLDARTPGHVRIEHADALEHRFDARPHVVVSNLPFHLTTALLRRLLRAPGWTDAVLVAQWEVARRRAGVGGSTQLTAQAAPWFDFALDRRIPRSAFRPMPAVDAGLFTVSRRPDPGIRSRAGYERMVADVFGASGRGLARMLAQARALRLDDAKAWMGARGIARDASPTALTRDDWIALWRASGGR
ncbi:23S ribosomal RNA methyltransferase Erm [Agrococcus jejuensis]|uniref:23S rRNA (Adenine-N6)-dimethyltransferase n=1 Tax=Agrococcus jejuensis TaxID=399736 RepID=A0A1G8E9T5_9MICO|nr:23S ribosomal RNA methyltransferase Erm [Agrococcus jejuensis]SDH66702.1 23S rRNA (adenine-N6)-dimethyltransferase [Agrococcus jejuensis]